MRNIKRRCCPSETTARRPWDLEAGRRAGRRSFSNAEPHYPKRFSLEAERLNSNA